MEVNYREVTIGGQLFRLEVADNLIKKALGLFWRTAISENEGMIFLFKKPSQPIFWTLGMKFPIDIVWVAGNKITGISKNVKAGFYFRRPDRKIGAVLEIRAGRAEELGLSAGDEISC